MRWIDAVILAREVLARYPVYGWDFGLYGKVPLGME
jgi:hypothetical protein